MPLAITEYEETPNPDALKCWLDGSVSDGPVSFLRCEAAGDHPLAQAIFEGGKVTNLLLNGNWLTICRAPGTRWPPLKKKLEQALAEHT